MMPLRGLLGVISVSMSSSLKAPYLLCVLMGSFDPLAVLPVSTLSFAFGAVFVSAGLGVDFVSAGFGCVEVHGTTPILICAIPDKGGAKVGYSLHLM